MKRCPSDGGLRALFTAGIIVVAFCLTSIPALAGLRVAIYAESGSDGESLLALARNVALGGHTPLTVTDEDLDLGLLTAAHFDVFILPEGQRGSITYYGENLGQQGRDDAIRSFVSAGGGFIGIGSGARYAAATERWSGVEVSRLGLWDGTAAGPLWAFGDGQGAIDISPTWSAGYEAGAGRVLFPGGFASGYWNQLLGYEHVIREYVAAGGGYIGISAGAFYAADEIIWQGASYDYPLDLYGGVLDGTLPDLPAWPHHGLTQIEITDSDPSIPNGEYSTWFQGEGYYHTPLPGATEVGHYDHGGPSQGKVALIRHEYGSGKAIYPNLHLEVEEGSTRDWMFTGDSDVLGPVLDPESEWDLFSALVAWTMPAAPASASPRPSVALASLFGQWDSTFERLSESQDDDAFGIVPAERGHGDGRLSVGAGETLHVAGFGAKTRLSLPAAQLEMEYSTTADYRGNEAIYWTTNGSDYVSTGLVPAASQTDALLTCDLHAAGIDTLEELRNLEIYFDNTGTGGEPISFDRVWLRLAADADADGAPDRIDCDPNAPGAFADVAQPVIAWEGKTHAFWQDMVPDSGEGT